jgi:hypothetical protein
MIETAFYGTAIGVEQVRAALEASLSIVLEARRSDVLGDYYYWSRASEPESVESITVGPNWVAADDSHRVPEHPELVCVVDTALRADIDRVRQAFESNRIAFSVLQQAQWPDG